MHLSRRASHHVNIRQSSSANCSVISTTRHAAVALRKLHGQGGKVVGAPALASVLEAGVLGGSAGGEAEFGGHGVVGFLLDLSAPAVHIALSKCSSGVIILPLCRLVRSMLVFLMRLPRLLSRCSSRRRCRRLRLGSLSRRVKRSDSLLWSKMRRSRKTVM